jgi:hypothetical protein
VIARVGHGNDYLAATELDGHLEFTPANGKQQGGQLLQPSRRPLEATRKTWQPCPFSTRQAALRNRHADPQRVSGLEAIGRFAVVLTDGDQVHNAG